jgi:membrane dipeptidase
MRGSIDRARALLAAHPVIDGHNDLAWELRKRVHYDFDRLDIARPQPSLHTDIPRLRAGGVGAQFWSVYVPSKLAGDQAVRATLEQIDAVHTMVRRYPDTFVLATTADEVELAARRRGWPLHRLLPRRPAHPAGARRPLPDPNPQRQRAMG